MSRKNKALLFPVLNGNMGALHHYAGILSRHVDDIKHAIDREILPVYREHHASVVQDSILGGLVMAFRTLRQRFAKDKEVDQAAENFTQYNFDYVFKKKNQFVKEKEIPVLRFRPSERTRQILQRSIEENVKKIRTIPEKYLDDVQAKVITAAAKGWDLHTLREELVDRYAITQRRADFIALSQQRLAITELDRQTSQDAGLYKMMWVHTPGLRYPRPSHRQAGREKRIYDSREGCLIDGDHIQPGQLYGCQCNGRLVLDYE